MQHVLIAGGGPAGAAAAIAARLNGSSVTLIDKNKGPHHKVCGEFLSPAGRECLEQLGVWDRFSALGPCRITRCQLHLGSHTKKWIFPESAWGLSRLRLDQLLIDRAAGLGAAVSRGEIFDRQKQDCANEPVVMAYGRKACASGRNRLFGFKAHFEGPSDDTVDLFFDRFGYIGVSGIENRLTNICGIACETTLRAHEFDFDRIIRRSPAMAERLNHLSRSMRWIVTGPIVFSSPRSHAGRDNVYPAGDALAFIDPFTGSGILNAIATGSIAGLSAARRLPASEYVRTCDSLFGTAFMISPVLRYLAEHELLYALSPFLPSQLLFRWTRARLDRSTRLAAGTFL